MPSEMLWTHVHTLYTGYMNSILFTNQQFKDGLFYVAFIALSLIYIYFFSIWTLPIMIIYSDGLGHFQSYRLRDPYMPQYECLGISLATSCLLGMQLCPKVSSFIFILFTFILSVH